MNRRSSYWLAAGLAVLPATPSYAQAAGTPGSGSFAPPAETAMPSGPLGKTIKLGEEIFRHTTEYGKPYIGNKLNCSNCHLDGGRLAGSAPLWAAYVAYPAYRPKNKKVNSFGERLQGCFKFSENGKAPPLDSKTMIALEAYSYWLATNAPTGEHMAGRGYPKLAEPPIPPNYIAGAKVYAANCALCHGANGDGKYTRGATVFPALWGPQSFNWGAGMGSINKAAAFIKVNMPLGIAGRLTDQQAWDVAQYIDSQRRPQDPRFTGSVEETRKNFHNSRYSMYGKIVGGFQLGSAKK